MLVEELIMNMKTHEHLVRDLELVRQLNLPNWYIAAGYVRNHIWDKLHGYSTCTPLNDIDVIYYDKSNLSENYEKNLENWLNHMTNLSIWSVKNQARMHIKNNDEPYNSIDDAISRWPETVTAVGIRLEEDDRITIIAPYGVDDIYEMKVRRSPLFKDREYYQSRVTNKNWKEIWPKLNIEE
ncbi:nucleotidyltransferase family protein [Cohnella sp.]|uniref:nucleotidyltransferase family protein n=1 Tax=Cohnella sp. TaxID=1883426 RepID=UPI0035628ACD